MFEVIKTRIKIWDIRDESQLNDRSEQMSMTLDTIPYGLENDETSVVEIPYTQTEDKLAA